MAHSNPILVETIAQQLAVELVAYQRLLEDLRAGGWRIEPAIALGETADRIQRYADNLPGLTGPMAEFTITRMDLSRRIVGAADKRAEALALLHADHVGAVNILRDAILYLLPPGDA